LQVANARAQAQQDVLAEAARLGQTIAQPDVHVPLPQDGEIARRPLAPGQLAAAPAALLPAHVPPPDGRAAAARAHLLAFRGREDAAHIQQPDRAAELRVQVADLRARLADLQAEQGQARILRDATSLDVERIRGRVRLQNLDALDAADLRVTEARLAQQTEHVVRLGLQQTDMIGQLDTAMALAAELHAMRPQAAVPPALAMIRRGRNFWAGVEYAAGYPG
jgi:hypothetical protein